MTEAPSNAVGGEQAEQAGVARSPLGLAHLEFAKTGQARRHRRYRRRVPARRNNEAVWIMRAFLAMFVFTIGLVGWLGFGDGAKSGRPQPRTSYNAPLIPTQFSAPVEQGYQVTCADGWVSSAGGEQGACSHHGGVR